MHNKERTTTQMCMIDLIEVVQSNGSSDVCLCRVYNDRLRYLQLSPPKHHPLLVVFLVATKVVQHQVIDDGPAKRVGKPASDDDVVVGVRWQFHQDFAP